jgi:trehalose-6-phosphate hydrolase
MKDFKKSVIYQIYPKSFYDTNQDGVGDLRGVIEKLDYLQTLGVDYIWLTPFYVSPQKDNGYDVADYYNIDPLFGTMEDFDTLVQEANKRKLDVMLDMVFNHTSTEHEWFQRALKNEKQYKDYYIFKSSEKKPPTNWQSKFGGSAWEYVEELGEYYLHLFDVTQADLNWENEEVRQEIYKVVNFWAQKGVKGFRLDVINLISKPEEFNDDLTGDGRKFYTDGPNIHQYLKDLNQHTFGQYEDIITVGEMSSTSIEACIKYSNPKEKELSMVFNFHHLKVDYDKGDKWTIMDFDFLKLKEILSTWQVSLHEGGGWNALFWCNHDQPRVVSRFGNDTTYHKESAKMLATTIHLMEGTPYIYQGEEIGMTNPKFNDIHDYRDVEAKNIYAIKKNEGLNDDLIMEMIKQKSRDNSRTPMQWNKEVNAGFTNGEPWIPLAPNYHMINVEEALLDSDSIFYHYQKLIHLRKKIDVIAYGDYQLLLKDDPHIFAYLRNYKDTSLLVINNFYDVYVDFNCPSEYNFDDRTSALLLSNYNDSPAFETTIHLRPYESLVYYFI